MWRALRVAVSFQRASRYTPPQFSKSNMHNRIWTVTRFVVLGGALAAITAIGLIFGFVASHRTSVAMTNELASVEFARLRARFVDEQPLLDMSRREASGVATRPAVATPLRSFHTVIFDTRGGQRLIRIDVPYWFARRFAGRDREFRWLGQLTFLDDTEFDPEAIRLSLDAIERRGPGLIADYRHSNGGQFISWIE
jgi:hypothetical protein